MLLECSYLQLRCELERQREEYNRRSYWGAVLKFDLQITSSSSCKWEWRNVWNLCQDMKNICLFAMLLKPHSNIKKAFKIRLWSAKTETGSVSSRKWKQTWNSALPRMHINWFRTILPINCVIVLTKYQHFDLSSFLLQCTCILRATKGKAFTFWNYTSYNMD